MAALSYGWNQVDGFILLHFPLICNNMEGKATNRQMLIGQKVAHTFA